MLCHRRFAFLLLMVSLMNSLPAVADDPPTNDTSVEWAIAIHGGAGGDPAKWAANKAAARQAGLRLALETGRQRRDS